MYVVDISLTELQKAVAHGVEYNYNDNDRISYASLKNSKCN